MKKALNRRDVRVNAAEDAAVRPPHVIAFEGGCVCFKSVEYERAAHLFREAAKIKPDFGEAHFNLGMALLAMRQPDAIAAFYEACILDPNRFSGIHFALQDPDNVGVVALKLFVPRGMVLPTKSSNVTALRRIMRFDENLKKDLKTFLKANPAYTVRIPYYKGEILPPEGADTPLRMGETETIQAFADRKGMTVAQLEELADKWIAANSETTGRATAEPRLKWGKNNLPDEDPATFAWRAYQAEAKAGTLHRGLIGQEDEALAVKLASWLRAHKMPEGIDIPTKPEWNTRQFAKLNGEAARDVLRLYEVARKRKPKLAVPAA